MYSLKIILFHSNRPFNSLNEMKTNDFKAIHVFNYLISIQLPLK